MEHLMILLNVSLYMLLIMVIGWAGTRRFPHRELVAAQLNRVVFSIFLPIMVFQNIYTANLETAFDGMLLVYLAAVVVSVWLLLMIAAPRWIQNQRICGAFIQASVRSNTIIFGMPIISELFSGQDLGAPTIITVAITVCFNIMGVITLETFRKSRPDLRKILQNIVKNPIVLASAAAIVCLLLGIRLPGFAEKTVSTLASVASPLGLFLIGACIDLRLKRNAGIVFSSLLLRLLVIPAIGLLGAAAMGWRGMELCTVLAVTATPTSVSAYSMAQAMDSDGELSAMLVGLGSILAAGTLFFWLAVLQMLHLL